MMLRYLMKPTRRRVEAAVDAALESGVVTGDVSKPGQRSPPRASFMTPSSRR